MTTRQFKFTGSNNGATGTITVNGTQVLNGAFIGDGIRNETIFAGSVDINNALAVDNEISVPTIITVTSGLINVALTQWNYAEVNNPVYSAEQISILSNPATTDSAKLAIIEPLANPPLSSADILMLQSTDPTDDVLKQEILYTHNVSLLVQDPDTFSYGLTPEVNDCNRANVLLNGVEPAGANSGVGLLVTEGQTLTYNSIVFASNIFPPVA